jgi:signal transduction histidine kinase
MQMSVNSGDHRDAGANRSTHDLFIQMQDYATVGQNLFWQRQMTFAAALALASFYYSLYLSLLTCLMIVLTETYDFFVFRYILRTKSAGPRQVRRMLGLIYVGTLASAGTIAFYAIWISVVQDNGTHFMALFFLFAAALFAAMNNHHLLYVLVMRLSIYGATFVFIPIWDIFRTNADIRSEEWAQLFTSLFVLYFIVDCSRIYLSFYRLTKKQMADLHREHDVTKAALRAKSEFLSTMSHELRTPLTAIKGSVDMAYSGKLGALPDKVMSVLFIAQKNCTQLVHLINEVLDLQKIASGKMGFTFEACDVGALMSEAVEANKPFAERFGVTCHAEAPETPLYVKGDKQRLSQVLANMLSNAAKFSPEGAEVKVMSEVNGMRVRILVIDQGIGLAQEDREAVFDRFSQLVASDNRKAEGTGLGMNISKQIIDAHGGLIGYHGHAGPGTTFFFELNAVDPEAWAQDLASPQADIDRKIAAE